MEKRDVTTARPWAVQYIGILEKEEYTDFTLIVGKEKTEFKVHKAIVADGSPYLAAACRKTLEGHTATLVLPNINVLTMQHILDWIYARTIFDYITLDSTKSTNQNRGIQKLDQELFDNCFAGYYYSTRNHGIMLWKPPRKDSVSNQIIKTCSETITELTDLFLQADIFGLPILKFMALERLGEVLNHDLVCEQLQLEKQDSRLDSLLGTDMLSCIQHTVQTVFDHTSSDEKSSYAFLQFTDVFSMEQIELWCNKPSFKAWIETTQEIHKDFMTVVGDGHA